MRWKLNDAHNSIVITRGELNWFTWQQRTQAAQTLSFPLFFSSPLHFHLLPLCKCKREEEDLMATAKGQSGGEINSSCLCLCILSGETIPFSPVKGESLHHRVRLLSHTWPGSRGILDGESSFTIASSSSSLSLSLHFRCIHPAPGEP